MIPQDSMDAERLPLRQAKTLLKGLGLRANKRLGQHFLVDEKVLGKIVEAADLAPDDAVIEVGPGLGILTRELARRAALVIAIELDAGLASSLKGTLEEYRNVLVIHADARQVDPAAILSEHSTGATSPGYKVVANLPYYVTSPVLRHFLEASPPPRLMVVMVQREVGKRIVAQPGEMSLLSVAVQVYGKPRIVCPVPARSFYPPPKVHSVVLRIDPHPRLPFEPGPDFFEVVRAGFSAPRKQLRNAVAHGLGLAAASAASVLEEAGINPERRAETLTLDEWDRLRHSVARSREKALAAS